MNVTNWLGCSVIVIILVIIAAELPKQARACRGGEVASSIFEFQLLVKMSRMGPRRGCDDDNDDTGKKLTEKSTEAD